MKEKANKQQFSSMKICIIIQEFIKQLNIMIRVQMNKERQSSQKNSRGEKS